MPELGDIENRKQLVLDGIAAKLRLASHISERDRRGPFETLWKKRIRRIQSENKWVE